MSFPIVGNTIYLVMKSYSFVVINLSINLFEHFFSFFHFIFQLPPMFFLPSFVLPILHIYDI
jgi:hypothetical protein